MCCAALAKVLSLGGCSPMATIFEAQTFAVAASCGFCASSCGSSPRPARGSRHSVSLSLYAHQLDTVDSQHVRDSACGVGLAVSSPLHSMNLTYSFTGQKGQDGSFRFDGFDNYGLAMSCVPIALHGGRMPVVLRATSAMADTFSATCSCAQRFPDAYYY